MDPIGNFQRTVDGAQALIASVRPDEWTKATPCSEWNVRALVNHMVGTNHFFLASLTGQPLAMDPNAPPPDLLGNDPAGAYAASARAVGEAWRAPGTLERTLTMPFGDIPGAVGININANDQLMHTWDLARALGRPNAIDPELAAAGLEFSKQIVAPEMRGPGRFFAAEVSCPDSAPIQDRLAAFLGRQP